MTQRTKARNLMLRSRLAILAAAIALAACQKAEEKKPAGPPATLITTTQAKAGAMEITEETLGSLEAVIDPKIGAEVAGKIVQVLAGAGKAVRKGELLAVIDDTDFAIQNRADEAERKRAEALLGQQERVVERQQQLVQKGFISQNAADDARAQRDALREQWPPPRPRRHEPAQPGQGARRRALRRRDRDADRLGRRLVKVGDPLFQLVSSHKLRAHLPFPESAAMRLQKGQTAILTSPLLPGTEFRGTVSDIKPSVSESGRALDVIVDIEDMAGFRPGGTVNAAVVVARREDAVLVPEQSVVLRPAGKVVYAVADGKAVQHVVEVGAKRAGMVEILKGLPAGATVALDGAGFLTHNATVAVKEPGKAAAPGKPAESQSPQHGAATQPDAKK